MSVAIRYGCAAAARAAVLTASLALLLPEAVVAQGDSARHLHQAQPVTASGAASSAAPGITAPVIARYLAALASDSDTLLTDSMAPRLEPGARYVAQQFDALELTAVPGMLGGERFGPYVQSYAIPGSRTLDYDNTVLRIGTFVRERGAEVINEVPFEVARELQLPLATAAPLVGGAVGEGHNGRFLGPTFAGAQRPVPVVVAGRHTPTSAATIDVNDKVVFYVPPAGLDSLVERAVVDTLARASAGSRGVVVVTAEDSTRFAARQRAVRRPVPLVDEYMQLASPAPAWTVYVRATDSLAYLFALAGLDLAELQHAATPLVREPLPLSAWFFVPPLPGLTMRPLAANVVGIIEGSDTLLKRQYVVVAAHLNPADSRHPRRNRTGVQEPEAVEPNAVSDASGVAALLAVARAFAEAGPRPRRSMLFVVTSGADHEFAGAEFMASVVASKLAQSLGQVHPIANLTLDLISGRAGDSVAVEGLDEVDFGVRASWITSAHGGAGLTIVSGSILNTPCADHCAFVRRKVPSLYLHDPKAEYRGAQPSVPSSAALDPTHTARVARLAFDLAQAIANAERPVRWSPGMLERLRELGHGD